MTITMARRLYSRCSDYVSFSIQGQEYPTEYEHPMLEKKEINTTTMKLHVLHCAQLGTYNIPFFGVAC